MRGSIARQTERTLEMAGRFVDEVRREIERSAVEGEDTPPRIRSVHERPGHATPEYRTMGIPIPPGGAGASPEVLSTAVARYAAAKSPSCLLLALEAMMDGEGEIASPVLIAEARDEAGTRRFWMQGYHVQDHLVHWDEPATGGWQDPGGEQMILDAGFPDRAVRLSVARDHDR